MLKDEYNKMRHTYEPVAERLKYEEKVKPMLVDIKAWHDEGHQEEYIGKRLGLEENEFYYMVHYLKIPEIRKIFVSKKKEDEQVEKSLLKMCKGYYVIDYVVDLKTGRQIPTYKYIPPSIEAIKFRLINMQSNKYQVKGQEPNGQDDEYLKNIEKLWKGIEADAKNKA